MLEYTLSATRRDSSGSLAVVRDVAVELDTSRAGRVDALNPVELLLAALAACMIKGVERSAPMLGFAFRSVDIRLQAARQDAPPKLITIGYELIIGTDETDRRLELLHTNVRKYGTVSNTLAAVVTIAGTVGRKG
jgi:uncharacterized OsmC-like protein